MPRSFARSIATIAALPQLPAALLALLAFANPTIAQTEADPQSETGSTGTGEMAAEADAASHDPAADLQWMETRSNSDRNLADAYRLLSRQLAGARQSNVPDFEFIAGSLGLNWQPDGNGSYDYRIARDAENARLRAQFASQILMADLNGDWSLSREEVVNAMAIGQGNSTSDLFLKGDKDRNDVLDFEEIKVVVAESAAAQGMNRGRDRSTVMAMLIDFDQDGRLTHDEITRAWNAFRSQNQ